ncbi:MAG: type II secretion system protein [Myxococcales bacterium]|nr:type II secretion system GspH family protein [Deltaproteobacteria bacterium]NNE18559.1 type II secretion system protein [Myxococcales bacterium]
MVEVGLVLCIVGIVLAVFVPTFVRRVRINEISEASELLQSMSDRASAYYAMTWANGKRFCLPEGAGPTPTVPTIDPATVEFAAEVTGGHETWEALGFQPDRPVRYSYSFLPSRHGCGLVGDDEGGTVVFRAEGDLDGDGVRSVFERRATIDRAGAALKPAGTLHVHRRVE